ncbi:T6SS effector phospholipase Tle3 domain-containing protein [Paraburkholderia bannensis]|uniref:T6SS effector phospholipase Tle3 domain-containing protein n=1 Tax=Paraburkholderia bannensis TaxID=765414 RepID=UPI002AB7E637|nr:hypothetical protein [Paraburkholderia bannensis]
MTDSFLDPTSSQAGAASHAGDAADAANAGAAPRILVGGGQGPTLFDVQSKLVCVKQMPLPGVVIFVHGVNSEGEWFQAAEEGLCKGLNRRLGRLDDQMAYTGVEGGQMSPVSYTGSLTADGYINPKLTSSTYIKDAPSFSPVIHFRWGYKANKQDMKDYGANVFLNEQNYWGGGPFANGCTSLADLWNVGIDDRVFGWITVQAMNPTPRLVYRTPPRPYMVMGALRLAKLIQSIRQKQADVPITVVCHSQGNMVGMAAAFLGDRMSDVTDPFQKTGRCVADAYVLANAPYSLVEKLGMDNWTQREAKDAQGNRGRETFTARAETLKNLFEILRKRAALEPDAGEVDKEMANTRTSESGGKPYSASQDRTDHGVNGHTYGRVTVYCCPHDQVISATTVQGIGWRGMSAEEIDKTGGHGVLTQRVFATHFKVGDAGNTTYNYRNDDWRAKVIDEKGFWSPPSPPAKFGLSKALRGNRTMFGKFGTLTTAPLLYLATLLVKLPVNEDPPKDWEVPVNAPALDEPFCPASKRYGKEVEYKADGFVSNFNEGYDPPSAARNAQKAASDTQAGDPYDAFKPDASMVNGQIKASDLEAQGTLDSEASQRYEDHAILRQEARRNAQQGDTNGWVDDDGKVTGEDDASNATQGYHDWHNDEINKILRDGVNNNPTNHSITMTNADHAQFALAYDVAIGPCYLTPKNWSDLRKEADWRFGDGIDKSNPNWQYSEYFATGKYKDQLLQDWAHADPEASMPSDKIRDQREGELFLKVGEVV